MKENKVLNNLFLLLTFACLLSCVSKNVQQSEDHLMVNKVIFEKLDNDEDIFDLISSENVNIIDDDGVSLLGHVISTSDFRTFQKMVNLGVNLNVINTKEQGFTALHDISCSEDFVDTKKFIELLVKKGLDINQRDSDGKTALFYACEFNNVHTIKALISNGIDVNLKDNSGYTAIMTDPGDSGLELLVRSGANIYDVIPNQNVTVHKAYEEVIDLTNYLPK